MNGTWIVGYTGPNQRTDKVGTPNLGKTRSTAKNEKPARSVTPQDKRTNKQDEIKTT